MNLFLYHAEMECEVCSIAFDVAEWCAEWMRLSDTSRAYYKQAKAWNYANTGD